MIPLEAEAEFPNIELETNMVDFGFIVNETTRRIPVRMRNTSCVPVTYGWYLTDGCSFKDLKSNEFLLALQARRGSSDSTSHGAREKPSVACASFAAAAPEDAEAMNTEGSLTPIHKVFDFTPFTGAIEPGATETVYIRYWGLPNREVSAVAVCSVSHGPEYPVRLIGKQLLPKHAVKLCKTSSHR